MRPRPLHSKLPAVGTTIFTVMSALAEQHGAINLSQGFPDFEVPRRLRQLLAEHVERGNNQYAPLAGVQSLREVIRDKIDAAYGRAACADREITIVPGATEALFCAITAVVNVGDEVILLDPAYDSYAPTVQLSGGVPVRIPLRAPHFDIDWQRVSDAINDKTRMMVLNSPHNPTGAVLSANDLGRLEDLVVRHGLYLVSDEVYEHLVFDGGQHHSLLGSDVLWPRLFAVFSFGKTFHATGWKTGYCVAPAGLSAELRKIHQYVTFVAVTPVQLALADFMRECPQHCMGLPDFYQAKRDLFCELLAGSGFACTPSPGTYFQLADYDNLSSRPDTEMARWLLVEHGVAAIPLSVFCAEPMSGNWLRFCFAKQDDTLRAATARLTSIS